MRILHTADWHLGQELHGFDRGAEHDRFLAWLLDTLDDEAVDALIVAGDVYDTVNPPVAAQQRLYRFLNTALARRPGLDIVIVGGNHDGPSRLELPAPLLDRSRISIFGALPRSDGRPDPARTLVPLTDATGRTAAVVAAIAYPRPGDLPVDGGGASALADIYAEALSAARDRFPDLPVIATGHLHVTGGDVSAESERPVMIGGEEALSPDLFPKGYAYIALGHLHRAQGLKAAMPLRYAGAPFPMSMAERSYRHSVVLVETDGQGPAAHRLIPVPRPVAFLRVPETGALDPEAALAAVAGLEVDLPESPDLRPYLEVVVAIDTPVPDLRRRVAEALGDVPVRLARVRALSRGSGGSLADGASLPPALDEIGPAEVFARLHRQHFDADPPDALARAFAELLADAHTGPDTDAEETA
ncbi:exonuclease SbcCD subunit D C-terminal domain-containing protein [Tistrella mobilis]|uniref:exonuclease SbcCD subunit D C-terminal domain-containing protein n=1 Tax=Tistrella mobilis TaxID=171437 RepID=UPI003557B98E